MFGPAPQFTSSPSPSPSHLLAVAAPRTRVCSAPAARSTCPVRAGCRPCATELTLANAGPPNPITATAAEAATSVPAAVNFFMLSPSGRIGGEDPSPRPDGPGEPRMFGNRSPRGSAVKLTLLQVMDQLLNA